jgi:hypothetical protein
MSAAGDLFRQALALPEGDRRLLAERLLETVDDGPLAAIAAAPVAPLTEQERAALAEVQGEPAAWISTEDVFAAMSKAPGP